VSLESQENSYQTRLAFLNNLDSQVSLVEKTAKKLAPIYAEVLARIKPVEKQYDVDTVHSSGLGAWNKTSLDEVSNLSINKMTDPDLILEELGQRWNAPPSSASTPAMKVKSPNALKEDDNKSLSYQEKKPDLRYVLGFLNQSEVVASLNIGNIMQIQALQLEDLIGLRRNE
jgi:hypothetical protein